MVDPVFNYADPEETAQIVFEKCFALTLDPNKAEVEGVRWYNAERTIVAVSMTQLPTQYAERLKVADAIRAYFGERTEVITLGEVTIDCTKDWILVGTQPPHLPTLMG